MWLRRIGEIFLDQHIAAILAQLDELGKEQLQKGEWEAAVQTFRKMLELDDHPVVRNNLATAFYNNGKPQEAWEFLEPELEKGVISPFAWALASMIAQDLGWGSKAQEYLQQAIYCFDSGVHNPRQLGFEPAAWREYTVIIKRAAGHLGEDRLVVDLHKKWERYYQTPEDVFQAGVALFNLDYPLRAAELWARIKGRGWDFLEAYITVAELVDQGVVPRFTLPYAAPDFLRGGRLSEELFTEKVSQGGNRVLLLAQVFDPLFPPAALQPALAILVGCGEWGLDLVRSILENSSLSKRIKLAAAYALRDLGVAKPGIEEYLEDE